jgi:transcriptional regulator with XRE-family HTH domain
VSVRKIPGVQDLQRSIGDRIRRLRQKNGWSQEEFAALCGLHRTYMGHVERGEKNLSLSTMMRIADGLGIVPTELFKPMPKRTKDFGGIQGRRKESFGPAAIMHLIKGFQSERQALAKTVDSLIEVERKLRRAAFKKGQQRFDQISGELTQ